MPTLQISLLGDVRVLADGKPLALFPTRKTRSLFAYLVTHRSRTHTRAHLAGIFWGDYPEARAHRNLNTTLWRLRHALPENCLLVEGDSIGFNPAGDYWLDVAAFEANCATPDTALTECTRALEEALGLYRGDFLEGWYEDWALIEGERLRLLYLRALHDLIDCYQASGALPQALECARRLLEKDSLREDAHRRLMELHAALGQRQAALAQFAECERVLKEEVGIAPARETVALYQQIRSGTWAGFPGARLASPIAPPRKSAAVSPSATPRTPFDDFGRVELVGRENELASLQKHLEELGANPCQLILLEGESGVGKTRLAEETVRVAEALNVMTLWGACPDLKSPPPYQGWVEVLRSGIAALKHQDPLAVAPLWLSELSPLLPELASEFPNLPARPSAPADQAQGRLLEAITQFLTGLARVNPQLIVLENLQWADPATLETWRYLLPRLRTLPVLFIVTLRPEELAERAELFQALVALESTGLVERLTLARLSPNQTATLARRTLGLTGEHTALAQFIYRETEGNPFFIKEVLKALIEEGHFRQQADGRWETPWDRTQNQAIVLPPPQGIRHTLQRRLASLAPASRNILDAASVLGPAFDLDVLQHTGGQNEETSLEATDDLLRRQLLIEEDDRLAFTHDKIRQVVYSSLSRTRCRFLHRQAGQALARLAPPAIEQLANHFYLAQDYAAAFPYCLQAGDRAKSLYANQSALTYYDWAIESARQVDQRQAQHTALVAQEQRGKVWEHLGQFQQALNDYAAVRQDAEALGDRATVARAVRREAWVRGGHLGDWESGLAGARRALSLAREAASPREESIALLDIGYFHNRRGEYPAALEALQAALGLARAMGDTDARAASLEYSVATYRALGEYTQALSACQEARQIWEQRNNRRAEALTIAEMGYVYLDLGKLDEAEQSFCRAEEIAQAIEAPVTRMTALVGIGALERYRGRCEASVTTLTRADDLGKQIGCSDFLRASIHWHRGMARCQWGTVETALADLDTALVLARASKTPTLLVSVLNDAGRCFRQNGDLSRAIELHTEAFALAQQVTFPSGAITAQSELGLNRVVTGEHAKGFADLEQARLRASAFTEWKRAEVLLNLAEAYLIAGRSSEARDAARECVSIADALGLELGTRGRAFLECAQIPGQIRVTLKRARAPAGRPRRDDGQVAVLWTVDAGESDAALLRQKGKGALRRARIVRLLEESAAQGGQPTQTDLANALNVTPRTIRQDFAALRRHRRPLRTRGK